ncbi:MAG TPA: phosphomannomutase [Synergistaceae bacterium]|nr:phosphomannomutase [Synergistaceae bacterium]
MGMVDDWLWGDKMADMSVWSRIVREYDIRGVVGEDLTPQVAYCLGLGYAAYMEGQNFDRGRIAVGHDGRISSPSLALALSCGLADGGLSPLLLGMVPTPIVYYATHVLDVIGGVAVTGSHNPPEYNGFKICAGTQTLWGESLKEIGKAAASAMTKRSIPGSKALKDRSFERVDVMDRYIQDVLSRVDAKSVHLARPKIIIDGGNGVAGPVAKKVLNGLGCDVKGLYIEPDGNFPNHHPDPTIEETLKDLKREVASSGADFGIAFDGDGDRIGAVDESGNVVWGDKLLVVYARQILKEHPGATIIGDVKCSSVSFRAIEAAGGEAVMWKAGHSLVKAKLRETGALMAAEMSGHVFFADRYWGFDDATYAAARLVEVYSKAKLDDPRAKFSDLLADLPRTFATPEVRIPWPDEEKFSAVECLAQKIKAWPDVNEVIAIDGVRAHLRDGWVLVRASNTQPALVLRCESCVSQAHLEELKERLQALLAELQPA